MYFRTSVVSNIEICLAASAFGHPPPNCVLDKMEMGYKVC